MHFIDNNFIKIGFRKTLINFLLRYSLNRPKIKSASVFLFCPVNSPYERLWPKISLKVSRACLAICSRCTINKTFLASILFIPKAAANVFPVPVAEINNPLLSCSLSFSKFFIKLCCILLGLIPSEIIFSSFFTSSIINAKVFNILFSNITILYRLIPKRIKLF